MPIAAAISSGRGSSAEYGGFRTDSRLSGFMSEPLTMIERAIQLAQSGQCISVNDVRQQLRREGYVGIGVEMGGTAINRQLIELLHSARQ